MAANLVNVEDILDSIELQNGVGDFAENKTRYQLKEIAINGVRALDNTQNVNHLDILIEVESDGSIQIPDDYLDYVVVFALNEANQLIPLTKNKLINTSLDPILDQDGDPILDNNGEKIYASTPKTSIASVSGISLAKDSSGYYPYNNRIYAGASYGAGGGLNRYGYFKPDIINNAIQLDVPDSVTEVVLRYLSSSLDFKYDILIPAVYRESLVSYINWKVIQYNRNFTMRDKEGAKRDYYRERRIARRKPLRLSEWLDNYNKQIKQVVKF